MGSINDDIARGKTRRKLIALAFVLLALVLTASYAGWLLFTKGYSIRVIPEDAAATQQFAVEQGRAFFIGNKLYVMGTDARAAISAQKYRTHRITIDASSPANIEVELEPLPATVIITPSPKTDNVLWSVNGTPAGRAGSYKAELPHGEYTVSARHPFYEPASLAFTAAIAEHIDKTLALTPVKGQLILQSQPAGARVTVNGEPVGETPLTLDQQGGEYAVRLTMKGYQVIDDKVSLTHDDSQPSRNYRLQPEQAVVNVSVQPEGGALLVNGAPARTPVSIDANSPVTLRYDKAGYLSQSQTLTLAPGETKNIAFTLEPEFGDVRVEATQAATVTVNGKAYGEAPVSLRLQALPTQITVSKPGYRTVKQTVTPSQAGEQVVRAEMLREFDARRREGKPLFISSLGIEMVKVAPRAFTMGPPLNDSERKSNEHQIRVDFTREVWISRHEITQAQYNASLGKSGGGKKPVTGVSWEQAAAYCNWLSDQEALQPFYVIKQGRVVGVDPGARGYRLPTEAEWEFIARLNRRAAVTTYVWGSQEQLRDKQGNFADEALKGKQTFYLRDYTDGHEGAAPVGSYQADRGGFFDLDGNVREWVHDLYTLTPPDTSRTYTDYLGPGSGNAHVVKGASYKTGRMKNIRATNRDGENAPAEDIGFRIARYDD